MSAGILGFFTLCSDKVQQYDDDEFHLSCRNKAAIPRLSFRILPLPTALAPGAAQVLIVRTIVRVQNDWSLEIAIVNIRRRTNNSLLVDLCIVS